MLFISVWSLVWKNTVCFQNDTRCRRHHLLILNWILYLTDLTFFSFIAAMELALSLEKLTNEKLLNLHSVRQVCWVLVLIFGFTACLCFVSWSVHLDIVILLKWKFFFFHLIYIFQQVASKNGDVQLADFVESEFLGEQVCMKSVLQPNHIS